MNTRHINTRPVLSAALAAGVLFASAPMQAQAPALSSPQKLEAKVESLQAQVNALQAQVKRLQAQVRASSPAPAVAPTFQFPDLQTPNYQMPNYQMPNYQMPNYQMPNYQMPNGQSVPFQNPGVLQNPGRQGFQSPGGQGQPPLTVVPQPYSNIPPCSITLIDQKTH